MHEDFIFNTPGRIGCQADFFVRPEGVHGLDQADGADGDQILLVGSLGVVLLDDMGHQAEVVLHQAVAGRQVSPAPPLQTFPLLLPGQGAGKRPGISGQVQRQKQAVGQQQQSRR